ncbi:SMC-Scp complex subunit ScpB [Candidatus Omnitrophota bacterium]
MNLKAILESILFVNEKPIVVDEICQTLDLEKKKVVSLLEELRDEHRTRGSGICLVNVAGGWQMCTAPENSEWIKKLYKERFKHRLSAASLEILSIIAYKQPVTRLEMESIRGVNCDQVVRGLTNLGLIKIKGRKEVMGRPFLYGTTRKFLEYFGLNSLNDLPKLEKEQALGDGLKEALAQEEAAQEKTAGKIQAADQEVQEVKEQSSEVSKG